MRSVWLVLLAATAAGGCTTLYSTVAEGPVRVVVRDALTDRPVAGAEVTYEYQCLGPRAEVRRTGAGRIVVEPQFDAPRITDHPSPRASDDVAAIWRQYNAPENRTPVLNPDGSWNTAAFRERSISGTLTTDTAGVAWLPVIHAPIRFRHCRLKVVCRGYQSHVAQVVEEDLHALPDLGRTIPVALKPLQAPVGDGTPLPLDDGASGYKATPMPGSRRGSGATGPLNEAPCGDCLQPLSVKRIAPVEDNRWHPAGNQVGGTVPDGGGRDGR